MKNLLILITLASAAISAPAIAADVGVSVTIGQPGFYGRLDIGGYPPPQVIYAQPKVIQPAYIEREPIYLRVPPGHAKHWDKHCHEYNACDEKVYFVNDNWYSKEYVPRYQKEHQDHQGYRNDKGYEPRDGKAHGNNKHNNDRDQGRGRDH